MKRSATLLEVVIGISLTALIVSMLMTHFIQSSKLKRKIEVQTQNILEKKLVQERLTQVFSSLASGIACDGKRLAFSFRETPEDEKAVAAVMELREEQLVLSQEKDSKTISEIIAKNVYDIHFEFLSTLIDQPVLSKWSSNNRELLAFRIKLDRRFDAQNEYVFFPNLAPPILKTP